MPNAGRAEAEHNQAQSVQQIIRSGWGMVRCTLLEAIRAQPQRTPEGVNYRRRVPSYQTMR